MYMHCLTIVAKKWVFDLKSEQSGCMTYKTYFFLQEPIFFVLEVPATYFFFAETYFF